MTRLLAAALLLAGASLPGCWCGEGVNEGDINLVPLSQEWEMGREIARQIQTELPLLRDPVVQAYVQRVGERLVARTEMAELPWQFHVVRDPALNAFAVPGGHVFVNAGLLAGVGSEAELAGVLAHEVAHGVARHGTERLTTVYGLNAIANLLIDEESGLVQRIAAQLIGSGAVAKFSRDDEREADRLGLATLAAAGHPPEAMAGFFETLLEVRRRRPNVVERFFLSHPITEERIANVREQARALEPAPAPPPAAPGLAQVQARVRAALR